VTHDRKRLQAIQQTKNSLSFSSSDRPRKGVFASFLPRRFLGKIDPFVSIPNIAKPQSVAPGYQ
jgi:hypothetical protein